MSYSIQMYLRSAKELGFSTELSEGNDFFVIKLMRENFYFRGTMSPYNRVTNTSIATHKYFMNQILASYGFPVPKAILVKPDKEDAWDLLSTVNYPLVAKPVQMTSAGENVLCYITNEKVLRNHVQLCYEKNRVASTVEEFHGGYRSFRVLIFQHRVIGVVERFPSAVIGDGEHTIKELVEAENKRRKEYTDLSQGPIELDAETDFKLKTLNLTLESTPKDGEKIEVCFSCNSTRGGTMKSLGKKKLHRKNARMLCHASRVLGMKLVGFDVNCVDINEPITHGTGIIIEGNHHPDVSIHENPMFGKPVRVTKTIMRHIAWTHPISFLVGYYRMKRKAWWMLLLKAGLLIGLLGEAQHLFHWL